MKSSGLMLVQKNLSQDALAEKISVKSRGDTTDAPGKKTKPGKFLFQEALESVLKGAVDHKSAILSKALLQKAGCQNRKKGEEMKNSSAEEKLKALLTEQLKEQKKNLKEKPEGLHFFSSVSLLNLTGEQVSKTPKNGFSESSEAEKTKGEKSFDATARSETELSSLLKDRQDKKNPVLTVVDLRKVPEHRETREADVSVKRSLKQEPLETLEPLEPLRAAEEKDSVLLIKTSLEGSDGKQQNPAVQKVTDFTGRLDKLLKGDLGKEIVKQTGIVIKDAGKGEIRLVLQPERLGKVRIRLDLDDNRIAARILVENNSIREVFEQNLEHLYKTFREGGFAAGSFDVFVQGDGSEQGGRQSHGRSARHLAKELEALVPLVGEEIREETTLDMVV